MLRLVDRTPAPGERIVALGESMLDREQRGGVLMTIDLFPVRAVAGRASTLVSTLLGRAIAHEIGHLLLGSAEHPRVGPDAGAVVARRAARPQAGALGIFRARSGADAADAAAVTHRGLTRFAPHCVRFGGKPRSHLCSWRSRIAPIAPIAPIALIAPDWLILPPMTLPNTHWRQLWRSLVGSGVGADNRIGGVVRDETGATIRGATVRAETGGTNTSAAPVHADDGHRRPRPLRVRGHPLGRVAPHVRGAGVRRPDDPAQRAPWRRGAESRRQARRRESPEAFGALAGVDSKSLSAQLAAAAVLYDEGRHDQAIAAYREIKARAPALSLVNVQIGNSLPGEEVVRRGGSGLSGSAEERSGRSERVVCDGAAEGSAGKCGRRAELVSESRQPRMRSGRGR